MCNLYLSSNIDFNHNKLKNLIRDNLNKEVNILNINNSESYIPPQTLNTGGIFTINDKFNDINKIKEKNEIIIVIQNSIKVANNNIIDYINIIMMINDKKENLIGEEIIITYDILNEYPLFLNIIDDFLEIYDNSNKQYIYDGCDKKFGSIINKYYPKINENNWTEIIFKITNNKRVNNLLDSIIKKYTKEDFIDDESSTEL